jgi:peptidoglycan/LPS O-acetylase OafA/YrhL
MTGLDGLRAIAVLGVVLYHLGVPWMPGGFLGVDVFFVLSGFLITTLIIEEIESTGRLSFREFYLRRARRLLPALFLLLAVLTVLAVVVLPEERGELRRDVAAALLYVSNWSAIFTDQSYFEAVGRPPLLQHLWSLAVEEQFYLLWPALVVAVLVAGRRVLRWVALIAAVVSSLWMALLAVRNGYPVPNDPSRVYFGTDTHASGLLLGAALASFWTPWRVWRSDRTWLTSSRPVSQRAATAGVDLVGVTALAGVLSMFLFVGEFSSVLYRGGFLGVAACTALLVAAVSHPAGLLGRVLGAQPLRYLGERSYGIYLWHWPLALLTRPGVELPFDGWLSVLLRLAIILAAAELSYRYVERPIRTGALSELSQWFRSPRIYPGVFRAKGVEGAVGATLALTTIGVVLVTSSASSGSPSSDATFAQPAPGPVVQPDEPRAETRRSPPHESADRGPISVFGDSVVYGASYQLKAAGARVSASEGRTFADVLAELSAAQAAGRLGETVVLHAGNNGPAEKEALVEVLDTLSDHRVYLITLQVPRTWESYNNSLFARAAEKYPNVVLLDWQEKVSTHPGWLYSDQTHLTAESGREGYARWLLHQARS